MVGGAGQFRLCRGCGGADADTLRDGDLKLEGHYFGVGVLQEEGHIDGHALHATDVAGLQRVDALCTCGDDTEEEEEQQVKK